MPHSSTFQIDTSAVEAALLAVLLEAGTAREGAIGLLHALVPVFEDDEALHREASPIALGVRDRDGLSLHVLAEVGAPRRWPSTLEPRFALGGQGGVDPATGVFIIPLRANGRVIGALMFDAASQATMAQRDTAVAGLLNTLAAVLETLVARTNALVNRRAGALRSVESVLEGMAHQMANPMTGASAIAQLLTEELQDEGHRAAVRQIRQELNRAFAVLQDLLSFQRDTGAHAGVLDLNTITEEITRFRGYAIREQGITLDVTTTPGTAPIRADARAIEHAMLLSLRFAELQSRGSVNRSVSVRVVELDDTELAVEITDSGPGNVPAVDPAYFDLRLHDEASAKAAVTEIPDLGLVNSILRGAGGRLEARGAKADGTTLSLIVPRASTGSHPVPSTNQ